MVYTNGKKNDTNSVNGSIIYYRTTDLINLIQFNKKSYLIKDFSKELNDKNILLQNYRINQLNFLKTSLLSNYQRRRVGIPLIDLTPPYFILHVPSEDLGFQRHVWCSYCIQLFELVDLFIDISFIHFFFSYLGIK